MPNSMPDSLLAKIKWQSHNTEHVDASYIGRADFTHKALAKHAPSILETLDKGDTWQQAFLAGTLTSPWNPKLVHHLERKHFNTRFNPINMQPELGRFYPKRIMSEILDCQGNDLQPFQITEINNNDITVDCNHPLASFALNLSFEQLSGLTPSTTASNAISAVIDNGSGLQAVNSDVPVDFYRAEAFRRMDEEADSVFYSQPRLVSHLDASARSEIAKLYSRFLQPGMKVLDLMSSWQSHLPDTMTDLKVTGLGMNAEELKANPQLDDYCIHDLNVEPTLPFDDNHFDLVICTASIEYLTQPLKVMQEIRRVLKNECTFVTTFTERWFPPKAIAVWSHLHPYEKLHFVADFFHQTDGFEDVNTFSLRGLPRPKDDPYFQKLPFSDPVYAVRGKLS